MVSIATVGYGDKYPVTMAGRITAVFVIGVGVVLFGVISSYLASTFIASRDRADREAIIATLKGELDTIKTEAADLREGLGTIQAEMAEIKQLLLERNTEPEPGEGVAQMEPSIPSSLPEPGAGWFRRLFRRTAE